MIYERDDDRSEILVLATTDPSTASIGGDKIIVYTCENSIDFCTRAVCVIDLTKPFRALYRGCKSLSILGIPSLSKQLHQMEIEVSQTTLLFYKNVSHNRNNLTSLHCII